MITLGVALHFHATPRKIVAVEAARRKPIDPPRAYEQLDQLSTSPGQRRYEVSRPLVFVGRPAAQRVRETSSYQRTVLRHSKLFHQVTAPQVYETPYRSPKLLLRQFGDDEWLKILRLPRVSKRKARPQPEPVQQRPSRRSRALTGHMVFASTMLVAARIV